MLEVNVVAPARRDRAPAHGEVLLGGAPAWQRRLGAPQVQLPRDGYVMPIFQHPRTNLDARWPLWRSITEPLTATAGIVRLLRHIADRGCTIVIVSHHLLHMDPHSHLSVIHQHG